MSDQVTERAFKNPLPLDKTAPEDIASITQACDAVGYLMTVSSPAEFDGVKGLTHDHVVQIDEENYMHLKHAYAVTGVTGDIITLLNPHGDNAGANRQTYNPALKEAGAKLELTLEQLAKELEVSKNKRFSDTTKQSMESALAAFDGENKETVDDLRFSNGTTRKLGRLWRRMNTDIEQKGEQWIVDRKNVKTIEKKFPEFKEAFITSDFRKGFGEKKEVDVLAKQDLSYHSLGRFFSELTVFNISNG